MQETAFIPQAVEKSYIWRVDEEYFLSRIPVHFLVDYSVTTKAQKVS